MQDEPAQDPFLEQLCQGYTEDEVPEITEYLAGWDASTYISVAESILDHAQRKEFDPLRYLRKADNINSKRAVRVPKTGYRSDGSAVYRKGNEYLIVRSDKFGVEKIVTYGLNDGEHPNFGKRHRTGTKTLYKPLSLASLAVPYFIIGLSQNPG